MRAATTGGLVACWNLALSRTQLEVSAPAERGRRAALALDRVTG